MAEETQFAIGTKASCPDGPCGEVRRIIFESGCRRVTHLAIGPTHRQQPSRLVPVDLVDTAAGPIRLRCTVTEFDHLDPAEEWELVGAPGPRRQLGITIYTGIPPRADHRPRGRPGR